MKLEKSHEYLMGYDCGMNGSNETNCHYSLFTTDQKRKEWERGKADVEKVKKIVAL